MFMLLALAVSLYEIYKKGKIMFSHQKNELNANEADDFSAN